MDAKGKSRSYINGQTVTVAQLKHIGSHLVDIHGQNEHHSLNSEAAQRQLLDEFAEAGEAAAAVRRAWQAWQQAQQRLQEAQNQAENLTIERERLQWQADELAALAPQAGEWEDISRSHDVLSHAAELMQAAEAVSELIDGDQGLQSGVHRCRQWLSPLLKVAPQLQESLDLLDAVEAELAEVGTGIRDATDRIDMDENLLQAQEARMQDMMGLARKYRVEPQDLPAKWQEVEAQLADLAATADWEALAAAVAECEAAYFQAAQILSGQRREAAVRLGEQTAAHMQDLAMQGARFHIELQAAAPGAHGCEQVQYQVAANPGSPLRPLNKVASGGELARISLALQMVTSRYNAVPMLIFDEVDTGIGGAVADTVGKALRQLGQNRQVLAVTHLPQVAACGEHHWQVRKQQQEGSTVSRIAVLDAEARIDEIARMLGGETITATTREHAAEMLALAAGD